MFNSSEYFVYPTYDESTIPIKTYFGLLFEKDRPANLTDEYIFG